VNAYIFTAIHIAAAVYQSLEKNTIRKMPRHVDVTIERALWVKVRSDYDPLFSIMDGMRQNADIRFWIERLDAPEDNCGIEEDMGQIGVEAKIAFPMSHNEGTALLTRDRPAVTRRWLFPPIRNEQFAIRNAF
jgi:hypothetical protein